MAQQQGSSSTSGGRLDGSLQHTALTIASFAFGAGWGDGTLVKTLTTGSTDQRGQFTVQSVGSNQAQATATVVLTFADGAYASAPFGFVTTSNDNSLDTGHVTVSCTTTAMTITFLVTPVNTKIYTFNYLVVA